MRGDPHCRTHPIPVAHSPPEPRQNRLLARLPTDDLASLIPHLELVGIPSGQALVTSGTEICHVYFPTTAIVSLIYALENGTSAEIAVIGNDGVVGSSLLMGDEIASGWAVTESAGHAYRMEAQHLKDAFDGAGKGRGTGAFRHLLLHYTQALLTQMAQTAICNRFHTLDQQLCRWLLLRLDRLPNNELLMTQEQIANLLGVRREGVTEAAGHLHQAGLIDYHRGHITVRDRAGLEARACECYAVVKQECDRLMHGY